jgi:hypothetical protein
MIQTSSTKPFANKFSEEMAVQPATLYPFCVSSFLRRNDVPEKSPPWSLELLWS